jgi:hypothetical protein
MKRALQIIGGLVVVAMIAFSVRYYLQQQRAKKAGIISESIVHEGDTWKVDFVARIPAPEKDVFTALEDVEDSPKYSSQIAQVKVLSHDGNKKTVEMDIRGPGGQPLPNQLEFQYFPDQGKITSTTVNNPMFANTAEYDLKDEGSATEIVYHQNTKMQMQIPAPDALVRQFMRGIFVAQLEGIKKRLNITTPDTTDSEGEDEEP